MEWSLQYRSIEDDIVPTARELGVGIVPYSPLGRGLLTATVTRDTMDPNDFRLRHPRFAEGNFEANVPKPVFSEIATRKQCTPAQLALAWLHAQGDDVFPIPGTKSASRLVENANAVFVTLSEEEVKEVEAAVPLGVGARYPAGAASVAYESRV
jgi:aryl-alcohol dehydrogenase-like predicted oxidoreductase